MISPVTLEDQAIIAWHEAQSEETLRDLFDRFDACSPREAWTAFLNDCPPPAHKRFSDSLAAPAEAGQGVSTYFPGSYGVLFFCFDRPCGLWSFRTSSTGRGIDNLPQWFANAEARRA